MPAKFASGKVREIFDLGDGTLAMVTTDRISAFDVVMNEPIPHKGRVLTAFTAFWSEIVGDIVPSHLRALEVGDPQAEAEIASQLEGIDSLAGRVMVVAKAEMVPLECIVRGYLAGSALAEYRKSGTVNGEKMPPGLQESSRLPRPIFTPSTKATVGHDENISIQRARELVGKELVDRLAELSVAIYERAEQLAASRGILLADTKFEFGFVDGQLTLCDEILTPDSSRFWPADSWEPGRPSPSFDKQPLRDWLTSTGWDKVPPPPRLPEEIVRETSERYIRAYEMITGRSFKDWPGADAV